MAVMSNAAVGLLHELDLLNDALENGTLLLANNTSDKNRMTKFRKHLADVVGAMNTAHIPGLLDEFKNVNFQIVKGNAATRRLFKRFFQSDEAITMMRHGKKK